MKKELALGMMRLPVDSSGKIDFEQTNALVDYFLEEGFRRFDTAELYHNSQSEHAICQCLVKRHPRDSFEIADKLTSWRIPEGGSAEDFFQKQLQVTGLEYFDRYLLHSVEEKIYPDAVEKRYFDFIFEKKAKGLVREAGFSFHGKPELLEQVLTEYPEVDCVQLQINYADWDNPTVCSGKCYEIARKHGKKILVMEPVKGGLLANLPPEAVKLLQEAAPGKSVASWAVRFAAGLEGVDTLLSGISNMAQMVENTALMKDFKVLDEREQQVLAQVTAFLSGIPRVGCTGCGYCLPVCPKNLPVPGFISILNNVKMFGDQPQIRSSYKFCSTRHSADECINCKKCTNVCPQHLEIPRHLSELAQWAKSGGK